MTIINILLFPNKKYENQDAIIPWKMNDKVYERYYYLFKENELDNLIRECQYDITITKSYKERDNYIVILHKN